MFKWAKNVQMSQIGSNEPKKVQMSQMIAQMSKKNIVQMSKLIVQLSKNIVHMSKTVQMSQ